MNWKPTYALILFGVTVVSYVGGRVLDSKEASKDRIKLCWIFVLLGSLPLLIFKYYNFLNTLITDGLVYLKVALYLPGLNWAIPIGISFFTLQSVGYVLDVYHQRIPVQKDFLEYALFVSFFPQVTSGPISTSKNLNPQIQQVHVFRYDQFIVGAKMILWGLFLKVVLADRIGIYVDTVYLNYTHYSGAVCYFASFMYTIQIYCDFAGYSLLAIGIAKTIGFDLISNFERPYFAASVTEFWKRWHISLTKWLTTHIYINLGGNRCSKTREYLNILMTFLVSGFWHGANYTFIIWGILHGVFQITEKTLWGDKIKKELRREDNTISFIKVFRIVITFCLVSFAWVFFRMPTLSDSLSFLSKIVFEFGSFSVAPLDPISITCLGLSLPILILYDLRRELILVYKFRMQENYLCRFGFYIIITSMILSMGVLDAGQFIYVSF